jgi:gas vesicle protein
MIQDFSKGKLGKEDTLGRFGMAAAGAGAGAAAGAGIGALVGGPAAPLTAAIGAVIGTAIGGVVGYMNAGKYQKEARNAAKSMVDTFTQASEDAFAAGNIEDLTKAREELIATHEANLKNITDISTYNKTLGDFQRTLATFDKQVLTYTHNADLAARTVGIGTDEMNRLANAAGIDLKTKMLTLHDVIKLVGQTTTQQVGVMRAEWSKLSGLVVGGVFGFFEEEKNRKETAKAANAAEAALATGNFSEQQIDEFLQSGAKYAIATKGELGGLGTMIPSVEKSLTTGALKNLTDEQKQQVRDRAALAFSDERILQSITQSQGGMQLLKDLTATSPMLQNKTPEEMLGIIKKASGGNLGVFLENLKSAQQRALFSGNYSEVNRMLTGATGQVAAGAGRGAYGPTSVPSPAVTTNNTTVNVSGVLDKTVVDRIVYEIERINRTNRERARIPVDRLES